MVIPFPFTAFQLIFNVLYMVMDIGIIILSFLNHNKLYFNLCFCEMIIFFSFVQHID